ncbi:membrane-bound lytic murein transglycosylase MltF [Pseudomonadota bacterium]
MLLRKAHFILVLIITLVACDQSGPANTVEPLTPGGELIVLTRNAPTTYYIDRDGLGSGLEHDLIHAFAEQNNFTVKLEVLDTVDEIFEALDSGCGHIAAAGLTATESRQQNYLASASYQSVSQQVVCRRGGQKPKDVASLYDISLMVIEGSSYVAQLGELKKEHPQLQWTTSADLDTEALLEKVWLKEIGCTVADSNIVAINRRYHPELTTAFDLTSAEQLAWFMPAESSALQERVNKWLADYKKSGKLSEVTERYFGFVELFDYVDTKKYMARVEERLPKYQADFEAAAKEYGLAWTLLAAQSYQESHWRAHAKSPTGVRGMMMLTRATAKELGVKDRLDAKQSIDGGARYLSRLKKRLPEEVQEPDRTWLALAAYNVGMGHMWDARTLAKRQGKNPNAWKDLKTILPLLSQKKYYKTLKYGYARGREPVTYVTRVRNFEDILLKQNGDVEP